MKIGLLAYHAACNFGAFLQLLSTVEFIKKQGHEPIVINWVPRDFRKDYENRSSLEVRRLYSDLQQVYYPLTSLCESTTEVANIILHEGIQAIIIGSDAVTQHHPLRGRIIFPCKRIIAIARPTSDRMFPNCFWGIFNDYLDDPVPVALMSGSSQDSKYYYIKGKTKQLMRKALLNFTYISVRDEWTQRMISYITDNELLPTITPDPVFAFNQNASHLIPSKRSIINKFGIPEDYIILSFKGSKSVSQNWINNFQEIANNKGLACVKLPYADAPAFGNIQYSVGSVITPFEWYALIIYSKGYVGNNMHPIVTSITNGIPFFSFDNYGIKRNNGIDTNGESSKIYHILKEAGLLQYRTYIRKKNYLAPDPLFVFEAITNFNSESEQLFSKKYLNMYNEMMRDILAVIGGI